MAKAINPADILAGVSPDSLPSDAPPSAANYRNADIQGVACAFCSKFRTTNFREDDETGDSVPVGYCSQWEAKADGVDVCDRYASDLPIFDSSGETVWSNEFSGQPTEVTEYHEIHMSGASPATSKRGRVLKGILRTGHWDETPTIAGKIKKPLSIVRDGKSDPAKGIISLSEIKANFDSRSPIARVQVPFSDKPNDDHIKDGNLARVNTGFVENVWIEDEGDTSHLVAEIGFTDKSVEKLVLDGSVEDGSSGIPFHPTKGAFLEHWAPTNSPFIKGLKPYLAASDAPSIADVEIHHHTLADAATPEIEETGTPDSETGNEAEGKDDAPAPAEVNPEAETPEAGTGTSLSFKQILDGASESLETQYGWAASYKIADATGDTVTIVNDVAEKTWTVPYSVEDGKVKIAVYPEWEEVKESPDASLVEKDESPQLDNARNLDDEESTPPAQSHTEPTGGAAMTVISREAMDALPEADRLAIQAVLDENSTLKTTGRTQAVDARVEELKAAGFSAHPGVLKTYRKIALSDNEGVAAVLLSDDGSGAKESFTATQIADSLLNAMTVGGKVTFSDQHDQSGNDNKPPVEGDENKKTAAERLAEAKQFLGKTSKNKGGE